MGKEFNLSASVIAIRKASRQSLAQGIQQVGFEITNVFSRSQEILAPESARFTTSINKHLNRLTQKEDLFWGDDKLSVDDHMRRNIAWLKVTGASKERIEQAKTERKVWQKTRDRALNLDDGEAIQFLAQKDVNPEEGVSLQQLVMVDGQLILQSQLLPFNDAAQINRFMKSAGEGRQDLSLNEEVSGWIMKGKKIDFDQNLPQMIIESLLTDQPTEIALDRQPMMPIWPQLARPIILETSLSTQPLQTSQIIELTLKKDRVVSVEPTSFWWQLLAQETSLEQIAEEAVTLASENSKITLIDKVEEKTIIFERQSSTVVEKPRKDRQESIKLVKQERKKVDTHVPKSKMEVSRPEPKKIIKELVQTKSEFKSKTEKVTIKPKAKKAKMEEGVLLVRPKARAKQVETVVWQKKPEKKIEPEIPWLNVNLEGIDDFDVPELPLNSIWWQYFNYLKDLSWLVSIRQFAFTNTNWYRFEPGLVLVPNSLSELRGSGFNKKAVLAGLNRGEKNIDTF